MKILLDNFEQAIKLHKSSSKSVFIPGVENLLNLLPGITVDVALTFSPDNILAQAEIIRTDAGVANAMIHKHGPSSVFTNYVDRTRARNEVIKHMRERYPGSTGDSPLTVLYLKIHELGIKAQDAPKPPQVHIICDSSLEAMTYCAINGIPESRVVVHTDPSQLRGLDADLLIVEPCSEALKTAGIHCVFRRPHPDFLTLEQAKKIVA